MEGHNTFIAMFNAMVENRHRIQNQRDALLKACKAVLPALYGGGEVKSCHYCYCMVSHIKGKPHHTDSCVVAAFENAIASIEEEEKEEIE